MLLTGVENSENVFMFHTILKENAALFQKNPHKNRIDIFDALPQKWPTIEKSKVFFVWFFFQLFKRRRKGTFPWQQIEGKTVFRKRKKKEGKTE